MSCASFASAEAAGLKVTRQGGRPVIVQMSDDIKYGYNARKQLCTFHFVATFSFRVLARRAPAWFDRLPVCLAMRTLQRYTLYNK